MHQTCMHPCIFFFLFLPNFLCQVHAYKNMPLKDLALMIWVEIFCGWMIIHYCPYDLSLFLGHSNMCLFTSLNLLLMFPCFHPSCKWHCRWHGMNQICYKMWSVSAHGWLNWYQTCPSSICHPSHHQERSCGYHNTQTFPLTANFQCRHFQATPSGPAAPCVVYLITLLQAYREPGMLNMEYLYQISTLTTNCSQGCFQPVSSGSINILESLMAS